MQKIQNQKNFLKIKNGSLKAIFGQQLCKKLPQTSILIVGSGGIGCEVLKNLSKLQFKQITIIDYDIIELSNLNRQFLFRKEHINLPKSVVTREQISKLNPDIKIQAIQGNIYENKFNNFRFYQLFDYVISALDNMKAREHLARNVTKYGKVLIDAGTSGYNGQSYSSVRFKTSCHNCYPSQNSTQNFAVCTIHTRPQKTIHCATYARNFYEQLFCQKYDQNTNQKLKNLKQRIMQEKDQQNLKILVIKQGINLFNYIFYENIQTIKQSTNSVEQKQSINSISFDQAIKITLRIDKLIIEQTIASNQKKNQSEKDLNHLNESDSQIFKIISKIQQQNQINQDQIWFLSEYARRFIISFYHLVMKYLNQLKQNQKSKDSQILLSYDKDDIHCNVFVYCVAMMRVLNFKSNINHKLKYLTYDQCKRIVGKIISAIASTNAMAAGLQINQLIQHISYNNKEINPTYKYYTISPWMQQKISYSYLSLPNPQCSVCSQLNFYFIIQCNFSNTTFEQFEIFAQKHCYLNKRDIYCNNMIVIKNQKSLRRSANKDKPLNFKKQLIIQGTLELEFLPARNISDMRILVVLLDINYSNESSQAQNLNGDYYCSQKKFKILNSKQIQQTYKMYLYRKQKEKNKIFIQKQGQVIQQS